MPDLAQALSCFLDTLGFKVVDVGDVDGLYSELKSKLDLFPAGDVCPPFDTDYGQRKFTVLGPDGELIAFGMSISQLT